MGLLVGGAAGGTAIGVAPGARWISVKIFADNGLASLSGIHLGFQWLLDPDGNPATDDAPDVANHSWGLNGSVGQCDREFEPEMAPPRPGEVQRIAIDSALAADELGWRAQTTLEQGLRATAASFA